jgi:hypothetical protein
MVENRRDLGAFRHGIAAKRDDREEQESADAWMPRPAAWGRLRAVADLAFAAGDDHVVSDLAASSRRAAATR